MNKFPVSRRSTLQALNLTFSFLYVKRKCSTVKYPKKKFRKGALSTTSVRNPTRVQKQTLGRLSIEKRKNWP